VRPLLRDTRELWLRLGHRCRSQLGEVEAKVDRYIQKKIRERAETIARTEVMQALNQGQIAAWTHAQKAGLLEPGALKERITTDDERLCSICESVDGETVALDAPFSEDGPPAHPACRCTVSLAPGAKKSS
jgi:SPP1 gp7 family putative phage head morphogenesis protein